VAFTVRDEWKEEPVSTTGAEYDVFELVDGKIKRFDCYPEGSVILTQLEPAPRPA
jgi:hypothetical protein